MLFTSRPAPERQLLIEQVALRQGITSIVVEKDFWVCWTLGLIFGTPKVAPHLVFKGGTSLSKVFSVISRFSEDIDLAVLPSALGFEERGLDEAPSRNRRQKLFKELGRACEEWVAGHCQPLIEDRVSEILGPPPEGRWISFEVDPAAGTPNLWFQYPTDALTATGYIQRRVKLEFGALTRQQPTGTHTIAPLLSQALGGRFQDFTASVVALAVARTFWEKATILHAEYHRPADKLMPSRFARHYSDFVALWQHEARAEALQRVDLLDDVRTHKDRFFRSSWAHYDEARLGTFRLAPPQTRHRELARDYAAMRPMFLAEPPPFADLVAGLETAEASLNGS